MDANNAVQYQNPAHVHSGTTEDTFTVASGAADKTRLSQTGIERIGETADLPLDLIAGGKGAINALGGAMIVGQCNTASGGFVPRPYTALNAWALVIEGGDFTSEFTGYNVFYTDGDRIRYDEGAAVYDAELNRTEIYLMWEGVNSTSGIVVGDSASGLVAGFGNTIAAYSVALGQLCVSVGQPSFAAGLGCSALGEQSVAAGGYSTAYGFASAAIGNATAAGSASFAVGYGITGWWASWVESIVGTTVTINGDGRSRFNQGDAVLLYNSSGDRLQTSISSAPVHESGVTTFEIDESPTFTAESIVDTYLGSGAFAEGGSQATGCNSHAEGNSDATGDYAHAEGRSTGANGTASHSEGFYTTADGHSAHAEGYYTSATAKAAHAGGYYSSAGKQYQRALASGRFAATGDAQYTEIVLRRATTNTTPAELTLDGSTPSGTTEDISNRFICATDKSYACLLMIAARQSDGTSAFFLRQVIIKNVDDTVSLEGAVQTVGVDINPAGWTAPAVTADDTNKSLVITVTGATSSNIRWSATVQAHEIKY